jgi:hypothetical protein
MQNVPFASQQEQVNKFLQANRVLGSQMDQMQGTTRVIFDTVDFTARTTYDFFSEVSGKATTLVNNLPATNISENRFEPGEGMVIKEIGLANLDNGADPATPVDLNTSVIGLGLINITIGNNRVIKDLPIFSMQTLSAINNINLSSTNTRNDNNLRFVGLRLFTNIVIPPQVQFFVTVRLPAPGGTAASTGLDAFRVYLKGYGKLFNPRNNY